MLLCLVAAIGLATVILVRFGWQFWTAILLIVLMFCPFALVWGVIQSLLRRRLSLAPYRRPVASPSTGSRPFDQMCWVMGLGLAMRRRTLALAELRAGRACARRWLWDGRADAPRCPGGRARGHSSRDRPGAGDDRRRAPQSGPDPEPRDIRAWRDRAPRLRRQHLRCRPVELHASPPAGGCEAGRPR